MPLIFEPAKLAHILSQSFARAAIQRIYTRNVFNFRDRGVQPGAIQTVLIEILANIRKVSLSRFIMAAVTFGPGLMVLNTSQIVLRFSNHPMSAIPILRVDQRRNRETQTK